MYLSDEEICKTVFNYNGKLLTPKGMGIFMSTIILVGTFFVWFCKEEKDEDPD